MLTKKLAVVDPEFSSASVVKHLVDSGVEVVVYCNNGAPVFLEDKVEVRELHAGDFDVRNIDCILECIFCSAEARCEFYQQSSIVDSDVLLLSVSMPAQMRGAMRNVIPHGVLQRLIPVYLPTFFHDSCVLECILCDEDAPRCLNVLKKCYAGKLDVLVYAREDNILFDRIGYFFAACCLFTAFEVGIGVEVADHVIANDHTGINKPGFFSILDKMGVDRFVEGLGKITESLKGDSIFCEMRNKLPQVVYGMIADGLTGVTGRGGFYRTYSMRYGITDQVIDLRSGLYRAMKRDMFLQECLLDEKCEIFSNTVWSQFFAYIEFLVQQNGKKVLLEVDNVLRTGYRWQYGVKELACRLGLPCSL